LHLDRGVICEDGLSDLHMAANRIGQRFQTRGRAANPVGQGRAIDVDPFAGIDLRLAVKRAVVRAF